MFLVDPIQKDKVTRCPARRHAEEHRLRMPLHARRRAGVASAHERSIIDEDLVRRNFSKAWA